jgi:hypothetical protein
LQASRVTRCKREPQIPPLRYAPVEMTIHLVQQICHLDRRSHQRAPTQGNEKRIPSGKPLSMEAPPPLCHPTSLTNLSSRPERSVVERSAVQRTFRGNVSRPERSWSWSPPKGMKKRIPSGKPLSMEAPPPTCHPERSRGICSSTDLSWKCFSTARSRVERSAVVQQICHPDRSVAEWRDLLFIRTVPGCTGLPKIKKAERKEIADGNKP